MACECGGRPKKQGGGHTTVSLTTGRVPTKTGLSAAPRQRPGGEGVRPPEAGQRRRSLQQACNITARGRDRQAQTIVRVVDDAPAKGGLGGRPSFSAAWAGGEEKADAINAHVPPAKRPQPGNGARNMADSQVRAACGVRGDFRRQTDVFVLIRKGLAPRSVCLFLKGKSTRLDSKDRLFFAGRDGGIHASAEGL